MDQKATETEEVKGPVPNTGQVAPDGTLGLILSIVGIILFTPLTIVSFFIAKNDKAKCADLGVEPSGSIKAAFIISIIGMVLLALGVALVLLILAVALPAVEVSSSEGVISSFIG